MKTGLWILKAIVCVVLMVLVVGFVTTSLWNWLVPALFAGPVITFWQALGLLFLSKIFLWTFGRHCHGGNNHRGGPWKAYLKQRWSGLSPEERDELKRKMKERWCTPGMGGSPDKSTGSNG